MPIGRIVQRKQERERVNKRIQFENSKTLENIIEITSIYIHAHTLINNNSNSKGITASATEQHIVINSAVGKIGYCVCNQHLYTYTLKHTLFLAFSWYE